MEQKQLSKSTKRLLILLICNSVFFVALYFTAVHFGFDYILPIYCVIGIVVGFVFFIYNRGFSAKGITPEMLPDTMSATEKQAFIDNAALRLKKSRWMLTILFPILLAIAADMIYLYLLPLLEAMFS